MTRVARDMASMEGLTRYQVYFVTRDGEVSRTLEVDCACDQEAVRQATRVQGAEQEVEVWERVRFVRWLPVQAHHQNMVSWQKTARLITLIAMSVGLAALGTALIKWSVVRLMTA